LIYKKIERGHFRFPKQWTQDKLLISKDQLLGLLAGFDFMRMEEYQHLNFSYYF